MKSAHDLDVERLQCVASGLNKIHTGVNSVVHDIHSVDLVLGIKVGIKALLNVIHNWSPRLIIVDEITKSRGINNSQTQTNAILLDIGTNGLYRHGFWDDVETGTLAFPRWIEGGIEEGVD
jgi:stage III sporulation protein SpoIIIAA